MDWVPTVAYAKRKDYVRYEKMPRYGILTIDESEPIVCDVETTIFIDCFDVGNAGYRCEVSRRKCLLILSSIPTHT